jgi:hypothetical protein
MLTALRLLGSFVLGFFLMIPLAMLFDFMNWPLFHSWGIAHGSFIFAWPALTAISFLFVRLIGRRKS